MSENILGSVQGIAGDFATSLDVGAALGESKKIENHPYAVVPDNYTLHDLEAHLPTPLRAKGSTVLRDEASFIAYVNTMKTEATRLFYCTEPAQFVAVLNDHTNQQAPGWRDLRASYACPLSAEWKAWMGFNGKKSNQEDFAAFIEANLPDIVSPPAANMLEIALTLEAKKKVNFASGLRLGNGAAEFTYEEQIEGTAAKGKFQIPDTFDVGIPVFENGQAYKVMARLRYRIDNGRLSIWYELDRPHKIIEDAISNVKDTIAAAVGLTAHNGTPS